ncbi:MAG: flagellar export protein FliJ [Planctomycetota bacterium]|jgi:flagellar export protein FliJ
MKKFAFRLQRLLDLAKSQEEMARSETARSLNTLRLAETAFDGAKKSVQVATHDIAHSFSSGPISPNNVEFLYRWLATAELKQAELEKRLAEEERAYEKVRELMIKRRKELLSLEKAQEKAWTRWHEENNRKEQESMEEIASFRHLTKKRIEE